MSSSMTDDLVKTVTGIKCLLYADDLVLWYSAYWCENNGMVITTAKIAFQTFALAYHSIKPLLVYKDTTLVKANEFTYLRMTFDTKLTWKSHIAEIAERVSNRLNVLNRLAGSVWGCARSTLNTTYKMFIQPMMLYCCEPLITATEEILKPLEKAHNQALRLITGGIKSTHIDAILLLLRIPMDKFFNTNRPRHLKTQSRLIQKAIELKKALQIDDKPKRLSLPINPLADIDVVCCTQLLDFFRKSNTPPEQMRSLALETINVNYPGDQWLQVFSDGSYIENQANVGVDVYSQHYNST
ncbi:unnamed protein product [Rodentolepis nana]|uniref:Reverse transcriptase domain-containing protein n=1 Tax=Rodentolepis nana TaxID=102285 RepID=A0A0R3TP89_RODNA|nr:unnamed protein product [Rodentolepis nana]